MRDSLIGRGQSILLVGEGNFSFSVELMKLNLGLELTSSCFEKQPAFSLVEENIRFLKQEGAQVLLGIDATRLNEYEELRGHSFHRIIFNFPHVGGKTKIQLNRELLRKFFSSCCSLLHCDGTVIVSLCRGQGGSNQEMSHRPSGDTWKVVEMAAHGNFVLAAVEPWILNSPLGGYSCVGRRSRDSTFQREGALVHIFRFASSTFRFHPIEKYLDILTPFEVHLPEGSVHCSYLESILLKKNLLSDSTSTLYSLLQHFITFCTSKNFQTKPCRVSHVMKNGSLRRGIEVNTLEQLSEQKDVTCLHLLWGIAFNDIGCDFMTFPASCYLTVFGFNSYEVCEQWLSNLGCSSKELSDMVFKFHSDASLLHLDKLALKLFQLTSWRELWASGAHLLTDENGTFVWQPACISPPEFTFDLSVASKTPPDFEAICQILWQLVGEIVQSVEVVDSYTSPEGWHSKCIRLTYCSYEIAMYRTWVVKLQKNVIGPVLEAHLALTVR